MVISYIIDAVELANDYNFLNSDHISIIEIICLNVTPTVLIELSIIGIIFDILVLVLAILVRIKNKKICYYLQIMGAIISFGVWAAFFIITIVYSQKRILYSEIAAFTLPVFSLVNLVCLLSLRLNKSE